MFHCGVASILACCPIQTILPIHVKDSLYLWNGLIDATGLTYLAMELFNYDADVTLAILDSIGSICIKAVALKIMHSIFSVHATLPSDMLLS